MYDGYGWGSSGNSWSPEQWDRWVEGNKIRTLEHDRNIVEITKYLSWEKVRPFAEANFKIIYRPFWSDGTPSNWRPYWIYKKRKFLIWNKWVMLTDAPSIEVARAEIKKQFMKDNGISFPPTLEISHDRD